MDTTEKPCMICGDPVEVSAGTPEDEAVLCILHYFDDDVSEEWERDDEDE